LESVRIGKIALLISVSDRNAQEPVFIAEVAIHERLDKRLAIVRTALTFRVVDKIWIICASEKPHSLETSGRDVDTLFSVRTGDFSFPAQLNTQNFQILAILPRHFFAGDSDSAK
jgi:hypothetical protein